MRIRRAVLPLSPAARYTSQPASCRERLRARSASGQAGGYQEIQGSMADMRFRTTDLCDEHADDLRIVSPLFRDYGGRRQFHGPVSTVKVFEDNSLVRDALEEAGEGRVLVVDGGGSMRCALLGGNLAVLARENGWSGVVVYGCVRDAVELADTEVGVKALNTHPLKSVKKGVGQREVPVTFGGVTFNAGDCLYADEDGIIVASEPLTPV